MYQLKLYSPKIFGDSLRFDVDVYNDGSCAVFAEQLNVLNNIFITFDLISHIIYLQKAARSEPLVLIGYDSRFAVEMYLDGHCCAVVRRSA